MPLTLELWSRDQRCVDVWFDRKQSGSELLASVLVATLYCHNGNGHPEPLQVSRTATKCTTCRDHAALHAVSYLYSIVFIFQSNLYSTVGERDSLLPWMTLLRAFGPRIYEYTEYIHFTLKSETLKLVMFRRQKTLYLLIILIVSYSFFLIYIRFRRSWN